MEWKTIYFNGTPSTPTISYEEFLPLIIEDGSLTVTFYFCYYNDASHMTESEISEEDSFRFDVSVGSELEMTGMPEKLDQYLSFELFLSTNGYLHSYDMSIYLSIFSENFVNTGKGGDITTLFEDEYGHLTYYSTPATIMYSDLVSLTDIADLDSGWYYFSITGYSDVYSDVALVFRSDFDGDNDNIDSAIATLESVIIQEEVEDGWCCDVIML
ncbi:hypothetical protein ADUPG1_010195 [Aduncisulcus paluster]|uniref:Uncharacterized protein n=1 Tax=Aduncisulcus paluster TaxID=2918883 RepID=A0ABQ5JV55_9EUKA|nr:hypothetical protein ADUPG1_010195 [Aduncisulcus paluster]